jgi:outer membrane receptor protein involved in Fe transport
MDKRILSSRSRLLAGVAIMSSMFTGAAHAQSTGGTPGASSKAPVTINAIVVTSRKRSEVLQKVPLSVAVVNHKQIVQQGIKSVADLVKQTPGVTYDQGISAVDTRVSIRGFYPERGQPSVAILVDGYDNTSQSVESAGGNVLVNLNLLDLQRVEIVKGPQAALYGRNAFGGAINYITAKPTSVPTGEFDAEVGNHGDYKGFLTFSDALTDKISYRASLETDGEDGFYKNTVTDKLLGGHATQGGSLDLLFTPSPFLTIRLYNEFGHSIFQQEPAVNIVANAELHNYSPASDFGATEVPQVVGTLHANSSQVAYTDNYPGTSIATERHFLSADYDLGWSTLSSRSMYTYQGQRVEQDTDYEAFPVPGATFAAENELQDFSQKTTQASQEFRLTSEPESKLQWLGGLYLFYEGTRVNDQTQYYLDPGNFVADDIIYPDGRTAPTTNSELNPATVTTRRTYHASLYGSVGGEILPNLQATASLRVAYEAVDASLPSVSRTAISLYEAPVTYGPGGVPEGIGEDYGQSVSRYINPQLQLDYTVSPQQNIYVNIAHGTKPAGLSLLNISGEGFNSQAYKQEKVWEYELGDKLNLFDNKVQIAADGYFNDYTDMQVSSSDVNEGQVAVGVTNAGTTYGIGQELEIDAEPTPYLTMNIDYSHINEYYVDYTSQVASDLEYVNGNFKGKKVPDVPPSEITANVRYEAPVTPVYNGFVQVSAQYESARYGNDYNTFKLGAFWEPRFLVGVEGPKYSLIFYMTNPFNDKTIQSAISYFDLHDNFNPTALAYLPDPMQFGLRFSDKF